ncbi:MAG: regulatory protein RecX [Bacteroidota bacterium]
MNNKPKKWFSKAEGLSKLQAYCAYQDRCHQEVRSKLIELGIYGDDLEEVIAELITDNFLNEERFARSFARGKFRIKQWGRLRIQQELKQRAISAYCMRKAMEEIEEEDYQTTLETILLKKNTTTKAKDLYERKSKLARYALSRGFESGLIWETLHRIIT